MFASHDAWATFNDDTLVKVQIAPDKGNLSKMETNNYYVDVYCLNIIM